MKLIFKSTKSLIVIAIFFASCKAQLAPHYDKAVAQGVRDISTLTLEFFSSSDGGLLYENIETSNKSYSRIIGLTESVIVQSNTRPIPDNKAIKKINQQLAKKGLNLLDVSKELPSTEALRNVLKQINKLKETQGIRDVSALEIRTFKGNILISLDQALTYENYLKR